MKFIPLIILLTTCLLTAQEKSILNLENEVSISSFDNSTNKIQFQKYSDNSKKSAGLGILYSLLLPGMGELYADGYSSGKYFTIADGILWGTFIGMNVYANWQEENYKSYAASHAGVNNDGKDAEYYATISGYLNIDDFNNEKALERNFDEMYNTERYFWKWETSDERKTFRSMWSSSEQTTNDIRFVVGALLLNRVASAINAVRLIAAYNKRLEENELSWNFSVGLTNNVNLPTSLTFNFFTSF